MWYIGQEIVALSTHTKRCFEEGKVYKVDGVMLCPCGCFGVRINIGVKTNYDKMQCHTTKRIFPNEDYFNSELFAPLDSLMKEEIEELMKVETIFGVKI